MKNSMNEVSKRKGLLLAGGKASRLYPASSAVNKHLLPIFDKPMVFYSLSILMLSKIKDVAIVSREKDIHYFEKLFGDGSHLGMNISYIVQKEALGIANAIDVSRSFIADHHLAVILGDNVFYGSALTPKLIQAGSREVGATIFCNEVKDPERFGIAEFNEFSKVISIEEKPKKPKSNYAVTGLYFYDKKISEIASSVKFSKRGEKEITSINNFYLDNNELFTEILGRGNTWLDTGTPSSLLEASQFISSTQRNQGFQVACLEEIALRNNWIDKNDLKQKFEKLKSSPYVSYVLSVIEQHEIFKY